MEVLGGLGGLLLGGCDVGALPTSLLDKRFFILSDAMRGQITSLSGNFKVGIVGGDGAAGGVVMAEALPLTHFLRLIRGVMLRGASLWELWADVLALLAFTTVMMTGAILRFRKRLD